MRAIQLAAMKPFSAKTPKTARLARRMWGGTSCGGVLGWGEKSDALDGRSFASVARGDSEWRQGGQDGRNGRINRAAEEDATRYDTVTEVTSPEPVALRPTLEDAAMLRARFVVLERECASIGILGGDGVGEQPG